MYTIKNILAGLTKVITDSSKVLFADAHRIFSESADSEVYSFEKNTQSFQPVFLCFSELFRTIAIDWSHERNIPFALEYTASFVNFLQTREHLALQFSRVQHFAESVMK